jgi:hypothetical protein
MGTTSDTGAGMADLRLHVGHFAPWCGFLKGSVGRCSNSGAIAHASNVDVSTKSKHLASEIIARPTVGRIVPLP